MYISLAFLFGWFVLFACLFSREREGMELDGWRSGVNLGGDEEGKPESEYMEKMCFQQQQQKKDWK